MKFKLFISIVGVLGVLALTSPVFAQEFTSGGYKLLDPVFAPGGYFTATDYRLTGAVTQISIGTSTSASYGVNAGFLYYPFVTTPAVSATAGDAQVTLTWTASQGFLGWTASSYRVGQSLISGGPYTYSSVGNVLTSVRSGLSNGVTYYFVVIVQDALGNDVATSSQASAVPTAGAPAPPPAGGGGGGGGGFVGGKNATVIFRGKAYPRSQVSVLRDAVLVNTTFAGTDANFETILNNVPAGGYIFALYADDYQGRRSPLFTFSMFLADGSVNTVSGIFLAPTIDLDNAQVKQGEDVGILGQSAPFAEVTIGVSSPQEVFVKTKTDKDGLYLYYYDTSPLDYGDHAAHSKSATEGLVSSFGHLIGFRVGDTTIPKAPTVRCPKRGDVNNDCRVNLVDFSITAYWWNRPLTQRARDTVDAKLWPDGRITLRDFSIMAYYWTG